MKYFLIFLIFVGFVGLTYAYHEETVYTTNVEMTRANYTLATLEWSQGNFRISNGTGIAKIIVIDPDLNKISSYADTLNVNVTSDSFQEGLLLKLYETGKNSGVFERTFTLSEDRSAPNVLYVREGDTATVTYTDNTLPLDNQFSEIVLIDTTLIGYSAPPLERVPATSFRIQNLQGDTVKTPTIQVDKQIQLVADIENQKEEEQEFAFFVQIQDDKKSTISLSWITGTLTSLQSFSPSQSWIPQNPGTFTATIFVWESVENPSALSPPHSMEFTVIPEDAWHARYSDTDDSEELLCSGTQLCLTEKILRIVDGDTIYLSGGYEVRLSLTNTPERHQIGFHKASKFTADMCPVTSTVIVDQDDKQPYDVYGRLLGKVTCQNMILNSELLYAGHANILEKYCTTSEFSDESWAKEFGC